MYLQDMISWRYTVKFFPKFSEARKLCCNLPKIQTKRPNLRVFHQKDANEIANGTVKTLIRLLLETVKTLIRLLLEEQSEEEQSDLGLHCLPRPVFFLQKLRIITVIVKRPEFRILFDSFC